MDTYYRHFTSFKIRETEGKKLQKYYSFMSYLLIVSLLHSTMYVYQTFVFSTNVEICLLVDTHQVKKTNVVYDSSLHANIEWLDIIRVGVSSDTAWVCKRLWIFTELLWELNLVKVLQTYPLTDKYMAIWLPVALVVCLILKVARSHSCCMVS